MGWRGGLLEAVVALAVAGMGGTIMVQGGWAVTKAGQRLLEEAKTAAALDGAAVRLMAAPYRVYPVQSGERYEGDLQAWPEIQVAVRNYGGPGADPPFSFLYPDCGLQEITLTVSRESGAGSVTFFKRRR